MLGDASSPAGVVLAQMGGPDGPADVEPFIRSVFSDPHVVSLPGGDVGRKVLGAAIARARGSKVRRAYDQIGGGSPIRATTERQAAALRAELARRGHSAPVAVAMRYTKPDTSTAVASLVREGARRLVLLPLYPHYGSATTGSSEAELREVARAADPTLTIDVIRSWWHEPSFLDAQVRSVLEALESLESRSGDQGVQDRRTAVVFSAHGVPQSSAERGDPYVEEIEASAAAISALLPEGVDRRLAYQSRSGPVRWVGPGVDETIRELAAEGVEHLVVVPIAFVSDHLETLQEIDIVLRELAHTSGIRGFARARVMNDSTEAGPVLADVVERSL